METPRKSNSKSAPQAKPVAKPATLTPPPAQPWVLWLAGAVVLALIPLAIFLIMRGSRQSPSEPTATAVTNNQSAQSPVTDGSSASLPADSIDTPAPEATTEVPTPEATLIDDDGQTLWTSPTHGQRLNLAYLPPGSQIIFALRPAALAAHPEGVKVVTALGPLGKRGVEWSKQMTGMALRDIDQLLVGSQAASDGTWNVSLVVRTKAAIDAAQIASKFPEGEKRDQSGQEVWVSGDRAYYVPSDGDGHTFVAAPAAAIGEIIDLGNNPPPLRRDVERLLAHTDADRQATLIVAPGFLFGDGSTIFSGEMARLRGPLFWFLGDGLSAVSLSMNWDDNFFLELLAMPTLDTPPDRAAKQLAERVAQLPELVEDYAVRLNADPYSRRVVARLPEMVRKLVTYTRSGAEDDQAVLRCYLPAVAGHNLLMGTELTLAQPAGDQPAIAEATPPSKPQTIDELLKRPTTLRFTKDTLEAALNQLGQDVGVEIVILGKDLQLDGITKNQSLGIDLENKPAEEILVEILRRANPDKAATGPSDARQKLVYVIGPKATGGPDVILVTTRAQVKVRGNQLPSVFDLPK